MVSSDGISGGGAPYGARISCHDTWSLIQTWWCICTWAVTTDWWQEYYQYYSNALLLYQWWRKTHKCGVKGATVYKQTQNRRDAHITQLLFHCWCRDGYSWKEKALDLDALSSDCQSRERSGSWHYKAPADCNFAATLCPKSLSHCARYPSHTRLTSCVVLGFNNKSLVSRWINLSCLWRSHDLKRAPGWLKLFSLAMTVRSLRPDRGLDGMGKRSACLAGSRRDGK